jgi:ArsR family transcriptional regulator, arsenate/arsenite/antimonite-responsive transcriptional repressor
MEEHTAVQLLAALAQGMRLRVFRSLVGAAPQGLTPGALSATLGVPGSTLSFHLKELGSAGLVTQERDGRHLIYKPALGQMTALLDYLTAHCCQGADCGVQPVGPQCQRAACGAPSGADAPQAASGPPCAPTSRA